MRKMWPSQDNCIQLKDKFASCEFGTPTCEIKAYLAKWKWNTAAQSQRSPTCESDFATCELGAQREKMDSKLRNQLARFSQVTMQRAKSTQTFSEDFSSEEERLGFLSLGVRKADCACHIEYEIAEEAMNFMSYVAEVSRGWDEPNARDMGRMTSQPNAKGEAYILNDDIDMKANIAAMARRLEELEMKNMQEVQAISQTPLLAMPLSICRSYEHLVDECSTIPAEKGNVW
uniref:Uncharacterized protein n=1 Tax=Vitis vinifera TaxID=29760 RepID=A5B6G7_VITVI|nr:hypothetical protein VITISV_041551 [Vitis vinifera]